VSSSFCDIKIKSNEIDGTGAKNAEIIKEM